MYMLLCMNNYVLQKCAEEEGSRQSCLRIIIVSTDLLIM